MDRTVLTGSSGPTPVLTVQGINKKSGSLDLKNRFLSRFPVFTVRPPGPVRFWKQCIYILSKSWSLIFIVITPSLSHISIRFRFNSILSIHFGSSGLFWSASAYSVYLNPLFVWSIHSTLVYFGPFWFIGCIFLFLLKISFFLFWFKKYEILFYLGQNL